MKTMNAPASIRAFALRSLCRVAVCLVLAAALLACTGASNGSADDQPLEQAANVQPTEAPIETQDAGLQEVNATTSKAELDSSGKEEWSESKDEQKPSPPATAPEMTASLAEDAGGEVHYVEHPGRGDSAVLVTPRRFVDGETPLIVSLHGFGANSAWQSVYVPLHQRVNTDGFALLLPNGTRNTDGIRFWNPTDLRSQSGKTGQDDVAYLTELVASAREVREFGPVYFFGYSNGGFMAYHMACKGLPGLRAVASLAGTSYVEDSICEGAPPVSVLHVHGTRDSAIRYEGDESVRTTNSDGTPTFYAGAREMVARWSERAGCDWPEEAQPYASLDLDRFVPGAETQAFGVDSGCADGVSIELWKGVGSGHVPGYGEAFMDALLDWLLA